MFCISITYENKLINIIEMYFILSSINIWSITHLAIWQKRVSYIEEFYWVDYLLSEILLNAFFWASVILHFVRVKEVLLKKFIA